MTKPEEPNRKGPPGEGDQLPVDPLIDATIEQRKEPEPTPTYARQTRAQPGTTSGTGSAGRTGGGTEIPTADEQAMVGRTVGSCVITEWIGRGAMGAVYAGTQTNLGRKVAIKMIRRDRTTDKTALLRFEREAKLVARFDTPHVVQIYDAGVQDGIPYIVMQYVPGGTVRALAASQPGGVLTTKQTCRYLKEAVLGLKEAQRCDVLHRDVKPDNLLLDESGTLKIADFGIAKTLEADLQLTSSLDTVGTPLYMSPEQCISDKLDFRSDMYSLGASFFYLLTGQPPSKATSIAALIRTKTETKHLSPAKELPERKDMGPLSRVIERMTALSPDSRYPTYDALLADLEAVERGEQLPRAGAGSKSREEAPTASRGALGLVAALVVLAAGAGGFWWWQGRQTEAGERDREKMVVDGGRPTPENRSEIHGGREAEASSPMVPVVLPDVVDPVTPTPGPSPLPVTPEGGTETTAPEVAKPEEREPILPPPPTPDVADLEEVAKLESLLQTNRTLFQSQGPATLTANLDNLLTSIPARARFDTVRSGFAQLRDEVERARQVQQALVLVFPPARPRPPFDDLEQMRSDLDSATRELRRDDGTYPTWLAAERSSKLQNQELFAAAFGALTGLWQDCARTDERRADARDSELRQALSDLDLVQRGRDRLASYYPEAASRVHQAAGAEELDAMRLRLKSKLAERDILADLRRTAEDLQRVDSVSTWSGLAAATKSTVESLHGRTAAWVVDFATDDRTLRAELQSLDGQIKRLDELSAETDRAIRSFVEGNFAEARRALARVADDPRPGRRIVELESIKTAQESTSRAFGELKTTLRLDAAKEDLEQAEKALQRIGALGNVAAAQTRSRLDRLASLQRKAAGMALVPSGTVKITLLWDDRTETREHDVPGFFLQPTEVTVGEYVAWLRSLEQMGFKDADSRHPGLFPDEASFDRMIRRVTTLMELPERTTPEERDAMPVLGVRHEEAMAYAQMRGMNLPTHRQWWLAARGPMDDQAEFAWGNDWTDTDQDKRNTLRRAVAANRGGEARRFKSGNLRVHHLAGNAAEWLRQENGANEAMLVGGSFRGVVSLREKQIYSGERLLRMDLSRQPPADAGFRCVLEPRTLFAELWPADG